MSNCFCDLQFSKNRQYSKNKGLPAILLISKMEGKSPEQSTLHRF